MKQKRPRSKEGDGARKRRQSGGRMQGTVQERNNEAKKAKWGRMQGTVQEEQDQAKEAKK
jgi:hypothetical protein